MYFDSGDMQDALNKIRGMLEETKTAHLDLWFTDLKGRLKHATMETTEVDEAFVIQGAAKLDGSSIEGFTEIYESDLVLKPDWETFAQLPWFRSTARVITDVYKGSMEGRLERDPRGVAQSAEKFLVESGYSNSFWGPEPEFFVFDEATYSADYNNSYYRVVSKETVAGANGKGYLIRPKGGYYPATPTDTLMNFRTEVVDVLKNNFDIRVEAHHHEVAAAGQCEIDFRYGRLTETADRLQTLKYTVKNVASQMQMVATFMPKPIYGDNGSGMHTHQSVWKDEKNLFYDERDEYSELSQFGRYYIGGLLEHSEALAAFVAPTTNSYKRLVPGYEAPVYIVWSKKNRSAACRVPAYHKGIPAAKRVEYRPPDPSCNPYLAFAAMLMAGLDGVKKKIEPGDPVDENIYHLSSARRSQLGIREFPGSLKEALEALESDRQFLSPAFPNSLLDAYLALKMQEAKEESMHPTPFEYYNYFDA